MCCVRTILKFMSLGLFIPHIICCSYVICTDGPFFEFCLLIMFGDAVKFVKFGTLSISCQILPMTPVFFPFILGNSSVVIPFSLFLGQLKLFMVSHTHSKTYLLLLSCLAEF